MKRNLPRIAAIATLACGFCASRCSAQGLSVSGTIAFDFSQQNNPDGSVSYTYLGEDFENLNIQTPTLTLSVAAIDRSGSGSPLNWSNALSWDSPVLAFQTAVDAVALVDHVDTLVGLTQVPGDLHALQNEGPTEATFTLKPIRIQYLSTFIRDINVGVPIKWDVSIPSGVNISMDQSPVTVQSLTVNSGAALTANSSFDSRTFLSNSGTVSNLGGTIEGDFINNAGASTSIATLNVQGNFSNSGSLTIQSGGSLSRSAATVNSGTITLNGGALNLPGGLTNNGNLDGYSNLQINIENFGGIAANVSGQTMVIGGDISAGTAKTINNYGTLLATNGGALGLSAAIINGGAITANNGSVTLAYSIVNGSTLNGGIGNSYSAYITTLNQVTNNSNLQANGVTIAGGSLVNNATITAVGSLTFNVDTNLTGTGQIALNGSNLTGGTITSSQLIHGFGSIQSSVNSYGGITADASGQTLLITGDGNTIGTINNHGTLLATNGGTLALGYGSTVNGGTITASNGSVSLATATINGSTLNGGSGDSFSAYATTLNQVTNNARLQAGGTYGVSITGGSLVNNNTFSVNYTTLNCIGNTSITGTGQIALNGSNFTGGTITQGQGHTLLGVGVIDASLINAGTIAPGLGIGALTSNGPLTLLGTSDVYFEIGGPKQGVSYDYLNGSSSMVLGGELEVVVLTPFQANLKATDSFRIIQSTGSLSGAFSNVANGGRLQTNFGTCLVTIDATAVTLSDFQGGVSWIDRYFTSSEKLDASVSGDLSDPNNNGIPNLIEYAMDTDPRSASTNAQPLLSTESGFICLTYRKSSSASDVTLTVQESTDRQIWTTASVIEEILADDGSARVIKAKVPIGTETQKYLRLVATRP